MPYHSPTWCGKRLLLLLLLPPLPAVGDGDLRPAPLLPALPAAAAAPAFGGVSASSSSMIWQIIAVSS
jgi:hypothetical protein